MTAPIDKILPTGDVHLEREDPVNWSTLKNILVSPKHYLHGLTTQRDDTEALQRGRVTHCAVYEPVELMNRYCVQPKFHRAWGEEAARKNGYAGGKESAALWDRANAGKEAIPKDMWDAAQGMAAALRADEIAGPMVLGGDAEQLVTWTDEATGIKCRGRVDHVDARVTDLKTSVVIDQQQFAARAARLQYHAQLAYYADGLAANGFVAEEDPALIVVESTPPHDVLVLGFREPELDAGRKLYRSCLERLAECRATGEWPGVGGGTMHWIELPAWAMPQPEELTLGGVPLGDF